MNNFDDQAKMGDSLNTQKSITQQYNHFAGECSTKARRNKLMDILNEEHEMQYEIFTAMEKRGWYTPQPAQAQKQQQACKQFTQMAKEL